jgi:hypothetical protein
MTEDPGTLAATYFRAWKALEVNVADVVEVRQSGSPVPPAHSAIRLSGDGADLIDAFLEDAEGVVAAGSFVP